MQKMSPQAELEQQYKDLTDKQKAVVDARVQNPDATNREIAHEIAPEIYNTEHKPDTAEPIKELNESYTSQFSNRDETQELIKYRMEIAENQREEGSMTTTGDPFSANPQLQDEHTVQGIKDRPVKSTESPEATEAVHVEEGDNGFHVYFEKRYLMQLLENQNLPPELHSRLVEEVIERAF